MKDIIYRKTGTFDVTLYTYSGMSVTLGHDMSKEEAKRLIRRKFAAARKTGHAVTKLDKRKWEIESRDDDAMVDDTCGILHVRPHANRFRRILGRLVPID